LVGNQVFWMIRVVNNEVKVVKVVKVVRSLQEISENLSGKFKNRKFLLVSKC
jgi:hypothetical protein